GSEGDDSSAIRAGDRQWTGWNMVRWGALRNGRAAEARPFLLFCSRRASSDARHLPAVARVALSLRGDDALVGLTQSQRRVTLTVGDDRRTEADADLLQLGKLRLRQGRVAFAEVLDRIVHPLHLV